MNLWRQFVRPTSISEALQALAAAPGLALPIAGGTDLLLDLQQGRHSPIHTLVDLTAISELTLLEQRQDQLFIGAAVPLNSIARHPLVMRHAQALVEACDLVGGPQVRNVATLGGNVAHALPAADGTIALLALEAQAEVAELAGVRRAAVIDLFVGPGKSALRQGEQLLVGFYLPLLRKGQASAFKRIMRPQGVALPILNLAIRLSRIKNTISDIRIAVGPSGAIPFRATQAEDSLRGQTFSETALEHALEALLVQAKFRSSARRASADYRRHLAGTLFKDTIEEAWERSK
jgi:xanthine dehydrogenase FAD-binding subunit